MSVGLPPCECPGNGQRAARARSGIENFIRRIRQDNSLNHGVVKRFRETGELLSDDHFNVRYGAAEGLRWSVSIDRVFIVVTDAEILLRVAVENSLRRRSAF